MTLFDQPRRACEHWRDPAACPTCTPEGYRLYGGTPPHVAGDDTSTAAAEAIRPSVGTMRARVLEVLTAMATFGDGHTDDELETITGFSHQSVSARRRELVLDGLVVDSGERRKTRSGRSAKVWVVA